LATTFRAQKSERKISMSLFDDRPQDSPEQESVLPSAAEPPPAEDRDSQLAGDPISYAASAPSAYAPRPTMPEDLRISWSWPHFFVFIFYAASSFFLVQTALILYYTPHRSLPQKELERYLLNKPEFLFLSNILWSAAIFLFLYVTLGVLRGKPFWRSLGWRKLKSSLAGKAGPWAYFVAGCGLAIFVIVASSHVHTNDKMPIQEILKNRTSAMLLMAMAVMVAPLVEETVFRGYLYPLFAKSFGMIPGILLTGFLFGLMHGAQLGWTWGIVGLLIFVGIIFTFARAYTGTVLASFLLHLGYNSMIAVATIIGTHGFTQIPTP
jgi:membrane protease YdiL (CAAX protease family)